MSVGVIPEKDSTGKAISKQNPFAAKEVDGKRLFKRIHGVSQNVAAGATVSIELVIPYNQVKINGLEIINGQSGDRCDLNVYDTPSGTISTVPNYLLNTFGHGVYVAKDLYRHRSEYDADLIGAMKVEVLYTNNSSETRDIYVNFELNELK